MSDVFFESSDRLLFVTFIILNERKFTLKDIIITCNTLDHSFLPLEKINKGISRLELLSENRVLESRFLLIFVSVNFVDKMVINGGTKIPQKIAI